MRPTSYEALILHENLGEAGGINITEFFCRSRKCLDKRTDKHYCSILCLASCAVAGFIPSKGLVY